MNKKIIISSAVFIVLLVGVGYYVYATKKTPVIPEELPQNNTEPVSNLPSESKSSIPSPFDINIYETDDIHVKLDKLKNYINPINNEIVSFRVLTAPEARGTNPTFIIYANDKEAGQAGGLGISLASFSPDGKYFAFRTRNVLGCTGICETLSIYVVDLNNLKTISIQSPSFKERDTIDPDHKYQDFLSFAESYSWGENDNLDIASYAVGFDGKSLYKISPREVRSYNPVTGSQVLKASEATE